MQVTVELLAFILNNMGRQWRGLSSECITSKSLILSIVLKPHSPGKVMLTWKPTSRLLYFSDERLGSCSEEIAVEIVKNDQILDVKVKLAIFT